MAVGPEADPPKKNFDDRPYRQRIHGPRPSEGCPSIPFFPIGIRLAHSLDEYEQRRNPLMFSIFAMPSSLFHCWTFGTASSKCGPATAWWSCGMTHPRRRTCFGCSRPLPSRSFPRVRSAGNGLGFAWSWSRPGWNSYLSTEVSHCASRFELARWPFVLETLTRRAINGKHHSPGIRQKKCFFI